MALKSKGALRISEATLTDSETRARDDHHESVRVWLRLLTCSNLIETEIRQRLQNAFSTTLPRFDLMAQLERFPDGLKMSELSQRMMVTGGNVTGITDMLEKDGLVVRVLDAADRRALRVKLTAAGQRLFKRMAAEHERWVIELFDGLGSKPKQQLAMLLQDLKHSVRGKTNN